MKRFVVILLILTVLVACAQNTKTDVEDNHDEVVIVDNLDFIALLKETGLYEQYEPSLKFEIPFDLPQISNDKLFVNEKIDTGRSDEIQRQLDNNYVNNEAIRKETQKKLEDNETSFAWAAQSLYEETADTFVVYFANYYFPGHSNYHLNAYVYEQDQILSHDEILNKIGIDVESVKSEIMNDFNASDIEYYGEMVTRYLVDDMNDEIIEDGSIYFKMKDEYGLYVKDGKLNVLLDIYSLLDDSFSSTMIYQLEI